MRTWAGIMAACIVVGVATTMLYRVVHPEWISYRDGERHSAAGQFADAADDYRIALEKGLDKPTIYLKLAVAQLAAGRNNEACQTARLFEASPGQTPETLYNMSELFTANGRFDVSIDLLEKVVSGNPQDRKARFKLAQVLTWTERFEQAIGHYRLLLEEKQ